MEIDSRERLREAVSYRRSGCLNVVSAVLDVDLDGQGNPGSEVAACLEDVTADDMGLDLYELYLGLHEFCHQQHYLSSMLVLYDQYTNSMISIGTHSNPSHLSGGTQWYTVVHTYE